MSRSNFPMFSSFRTHVGTLVVVLVTVLASSAVAAADDPEQVIRALYKAHRPWEQKN